MRVFCYDEPAFANDGSFMGGEVKTITENEIIETYYSFWERKMIHKYGKGHHLISKDNCIEDWVVAHWAWQKMED